MIHTRFLQPMNANLALQGAREPCSRALRRSLKPGARADKLQKTVLPESHIKKRSNGVWVRTVDSMIDVFISYCRSDAGLAGLLASRLEMEGWKVWWDPQLLAGENVTRAVTSALDESRCVLVLWSHRSVQRDWVLNEAEDGRTRGILVPVRIDQVKLPLPFRMIHTIDLSDTSFRGDDGIDQVVRAVRAKLESGSLPVVMTELNDPQFKQAVQLFRERHFIASLEGFRAVVKRYPESSEGRYFLVLCALAGRRPKLLRSERVAEIDMLLREADRSARGDAAHIRHLWAMLRYDCYTLNGLREPAPTASELLAGAKPLESARAKELTSTIVAPGNPLWEALVTPDLAVEANARTTAKEP
jgi:hypothetical protein